MFALPRSIFSMQAATIISDSRLAARSLLAALQFHDH
jgi:hypothetical protein